MDYVVERPMEESDKESICALCNEKSTRKYNVSAIFKGSGFYSIDKRPTKKASNGK